MSYDPTDAFFLTTDKGGVAIPALLTNTIGVSAEVPVILDLEGTTMKISGMDVVNSNTQCVVQSKYYPSPENESGATIIVQATAYNIHRAIPDADGTTILILSRD